MINKADLNQIFFHLSTLTKERSVILFRNNGKIIEKIESFGTYKNVRIPVTEVLNIVKSNTEINEVIFIHNHPGCTKEPSIKDKQNALHRRSLLSANNINNVKHFIVISNNVLSQGTSILPVKITEY